MGVLHDLMMVTLGVVLGYFVCALCMMGRDN